MARSVRASFPRRNAHRRQHHAEAPFVFVSVSLRMRHQYVATTPRTVQKGAAELLDRA
jgi:hypothetical protein